MPAVGAACRRGVAHRDGGARRRRGVTGGDGSARREGVTDHNGTACCGQACRDEGSMPNYAISTLKRALIA